MPFHLLGLHHCIHPNSRIVHKFRHIFLKRRPFCKKKALSDRRTNVFETKGTKFISNTVLLPFGRWHIFMFTKYVYKIRRRCFCVFRYCRKLCRLRTKSPNQEGELQNISLTKEHCIKSANLWNNSFRGYDNNYVSLRQIHIIIFN